MPQAAPTINAMKKQGGQKANVSAKVGECLALLYLQSKYPRTMIRFNPSQDKFRPHDVEQFEKQEYLDAIGEPAVYRSAPLRVWEVKAIRKGSHCFEVNPDAHKRLNRVKVRKGKYYVFVLFTEIFDELKYFPDSLKFSFSVQEVQAIKVNRLLKKAKYHRTNKKLSFRYFFHKEAYLKPTST